MQNAGREKIMAISSLHIEGGANGFFAHNSREKKTVNSIFDDEENFCSCSNAEAFKIYKDELEKRTKAYCENKGRKKLHAKTKTHLSAIVNFNKEHTPDDIKKVCDYLEKTFDTKIVQYAMHRDEGHISDTGEKLKNYHAHIEFMGLDSQGNSITQKLKRKELIELQSDVADILQMERGRNYTKEKAQRPKRFGTYEYKKHAKDVSVSQKELEDVLKQENLKLRSELKELKAERKDYQKLEETVKDLKEQLKRKNLGRNELLNALKKFKKENSILTFAKDEMRREMDLLVNGSVQKNVEIKELKDFIKMRNITIKSQIKAIDTQKTIISNLEHELEVLKKKNKSYYGLNEDLKMQIKDLKNQIKEEPQTSTRKYMY